MSEYTISEAIDNSAYKQGSPEWANSASSTADIDQLESLGYSSHFERSMSKWENFSLGFTYLSPVVGVYTVFALGLTAGGPPMVWSYVLVGLCQLLVCLVFGEMVSQFPIAGGLYPWARRLVGKRWAWMAGWVYAWALCTTISAVATGASPFVAQLLNMDVTPANTTGIAIALIVVTTLLNLSGTRMLAKVAMFGFICELVGAIVVGAYLLIFARHLPFGAIFDSFGVQGNGSYLPAFLAASLGAMFCYYGFEACADVAEETPNPGTAIPKAMRMTIYIGGASAILVCLALILAVPNIADVLSGKDKDPVGTTLRAALGDWGFRAVIMVVLVSFASCLLSLQAAASRLLFAYARDEMIIGSAALSKLSVSTRVPVTALLVTGIVPASLALCGLWLENAVSTIVSFAAVGIYIAFQMLVLAALVARWKGWRPSGAFTLGVWAWPVNILALAYGLFAIANMVWPRSPNDPWFSNYGMMISSALVIVSGLAYMWIGKPYARGTSPSGDAHLLHLKA